MSKTFNILRNHPARSLRCSVTRFKVYTVQRAKAQFDKLLADVEAGCVIDVTRHGRAVASILSNAKLETLEILADPEAMRAIRAAEKAKAAKVKAARRGGKSRTKK